MMSDALIKDAILRIGEVSGIEGRKVYILLDKNKNASELLFDGDILKNVSVGSYVEIRKGFLSIIGKVEGEKLIEDSIRSYDGESGYQIIDKNKRTLTISLSGYIGTDGNFIGGIKELPLIGNEAFILTDDKIHTIHNLLKYESALKITVARTDIEEVPISFPIDGLFNSHIAIFGNTGSGKSNTLAALYQEMIATLKHRPNYKNNCRFFIFDFNGEYVEDTCITSDKKVYNLSTRTRDNIEDKIPMSFDDLIDLETLSILLEATEKTQRPFLKRTMRFYKNIHQKGEPASYVKAILQTKVKEVLQMANKDTAFKLLDYIEEILIIYIEKETDLTFDKEQEKKENIRKGLDYHNTSKEFMHNGVHLNSNPAEIDKVGFYTTIEEIFENWNDFIEFEQFYVILHLQLIEDLYRYKVQNEHIYPVINRYKAKQKDIDRTFKIEPTKDIWDNFNVVVVNLRNVNLDMRKTIPLLLAKHIYKEHKEANKTKLLSIIIDEAHNILSKTSFRETEDWKDYRLETFEEIIKEGRKFGVFVTIASQRPNDISETIISQAHNYFIHQLINQRDLNTIGNAVSYIDKITEESIPTLPIGTCIFSGIATPMPLKIRIEELPDRAKPDSHTLQFDKISGVDND